MQHAIEQSVRSIPLLIKHCDRLLNQEIDQLLKRHDIARSQYRVMYFINSLGAPTQQELAAALEVSPATITQLVDALELKGWVARNGGTDRRYKLIGLTPQGQAKFDSVRDPAAVVQETLSSHMPPSEVRELELLLRKVLEHLQAHKR